MALQVKPPSVMHLLWVLLVQILVTSLLIQLAANGLVKPQKTPQGLGTLYPHERPELLGFRSVQQLLSVAIIWEVNQMKS